MANIILKLSINSFVGSFLLISDKSSARLDSEARINSFVDSFLLISDKLSARLHSESVINLKLSINFSLYVITLLLSSSFLIGTEKVMYFAVFFPKQSTLPLNSSINFLIINDNHI